jgi:hypothetical protein
MTVSLDLGGQIFFCPAKVLAAKTGLFGKGTSPGTYAIKSEVSAEAVQAYVWTLEGKPVKASAAIRAEIVKLSEEFDSPDVPSSIVLEQGSAVGKLVLIPAVILVVAIVLFFLRQKRSSA